MLFTWSWDSESEFYSDLDLHTVIDDWGLSIVSIHSFLMVSFGVCQSLSQKPD